MGLAQFEQYRVYCWCPDLGVWCGPAGLSSHYIELEPGDRATQLHRLNWARSNCRGQWAYDTEGVVPTNWIFYFAHQGDLANFRLAVGL